MGTPRIPKRKKQPRYHIYVAICDVCGEIYRNRNDLRVKAKAEEHRKKRGKKHFVWVIAQPVY